MGIPIGVIQNQMLKRGKYEQLAQDGMLGRSFGKYITDKSQMSPQVQTYAANNPEVMDALNRYIKTQSFYNPQSQNGYPVAQRMQAYMPQVQNLQAGTSYNPMLAQEIRGYGLIPQQQRPMIRQDQVNNLYGRRFIQQDQRPAFNYNGAMMGGR